MSRATFHERIGDLAAERVNRSLAQELEELKGKHLALETDLAQSRAHVAAVRKRCAEQVLAARAERDRAITARDDAIDKLNESRARRLDAMEGVL